MTRIEFLNELSQKLSKLPQEEINNVLSYYDEIFLDAGVENEAETAKNLGNIDDIARQILIDNNIAPDGEAEYFMQNNVSQQGTKPKSNNVAIKLLILLLTSPIWLPVLVAVVSVVFGILVAIVAVVFALIVAGIACVASGIVALFVEPFAGLFVLGLGLIICGIYGLIAMPVCRCIFRVLKGLFNSIINWCHGLIEKRRGA